MTEILSFERELLARGLRLAAAGRNADALNCLEHLVDLPDLEPATREAAFRALAELHFDAEDWKRARRYWAAALILEPTCAETHYRMAQAILVDPTVPAKRAWNHLHLAVAIHPMEAKMWSLLGRCAMKMNRPNEATRCFRKCLSLKPAAQAVLDETAEGLADLGKPEFARSLIRKGGFGLTARNRAYLEKQFTMHMAVKTQNAEHRPMRKHVTLRFPQFERETIGASETGGILRFDAASKPAPRLLAFRAMKADK